MTSTVTITYDSSDTVALEAIRLMRQMECLKVSKSTPVKSGKAQTAGGRRKKRILNEIRQSVRHANELEDTNAKTYTLEELIESL